MTLQEQLLKKRDMPKLIRQMTLFQEFLFLGDFWGGKSQKSLKKEGGEVSGWQGPKRLTEIEKIRALYSENPGASCHNNLLLVINYYGR